MGNLLKPVVASCRVIFISFDSYRDHVDAVLAALDGKPVKATHGLCMDGKCVGIAICFATAAEAERFMTKLAALEIPGLLAGMISRDS